MTAEDAHLIEGFENGTAAQFGHEDHIRVAWLYLQEMSLTGAIDRFRKGAMAFARSRGKPEIYNETMTWAYLILIAERIARCGDSSSWVEFTKGSADLFEAKHAVLKRYYREETLSSEFARGVAVLPERVRGS
jgi:hypothetical protein